MSLKVQLVQGGVVANVLLFEAGSALNGNSVTLPDASTFNPPSGATLMAQAGAGIGWTLSGGVLSAPAPSDPALTKPQLTTYANATRWSLSRGGKTLTVAGTPRLFDTDPSSMQLVNNMVARLGQASPPATIDWQFDAGFVTISAANFIIAAAALSDWLLATLATLKVVRAAIDAGTITTYAQIDAAAWPSSA